MGMRARFAEDDSDPAMFPRSTRTRVIARDYSSSSSSTTPHSVSELPFAAI